MGCCTKENVKNYANKAVENTKKTVKEKINEIFEDSMKDFLIGEYITDEFRNKFLEYLNEVRDLRLLSSCVKLNKNLNLIASQYNYLKLREYLGYESDSFQDGLPIPKYKGNEVGVSTFPFEKDTELSEVECINTWIEDISEEEKEMLKEKYNKKKVNKKENDDGEEENKKEEKKVENENPDLKKKERELGRVFKNKWEKEFYREIRNKDYLNVLDENLSEVGISVYKDAITENRMLCVIFSPLRKESP